MLVVVWYWKPHTWAFPVVLWMCPVPIELITGIKATERASWLRACWGECLALFQLLGELLGSQSCLRIAFLACEMCRIWNKFYIDIKYAFYHFLLWVYSLERPGEQTWEPNLSWRLGLHPFLLWKLNLEQFLQLGSCWGNTKSFNLCDCSFCFFQEACALQYYFLILWRILGILPPSKTYMNQLAVNSPEMSECDILHTLRWSSRLRISSYVNWIKVPQGLLLWSIQSQHTLILGTFKFKANESLRRCLCWSPEHFLLAVNRTTLSNREWRLNMLVLS